MKAESTLLKDGDVQLLNNVDLRHFLMNVAEGTVLLQFTFSPEESDTLVEFSRVSLIKVSLDPEIGGDLAFVGQVDAFRFDDSGQEVLSRLEHRLEKEPGVFRTLPEQVGFFFHIEGDVCADIVCGAYSVRKVPFGSTPRLAA